MLDVGVTGLDPNAFEFDNLEAELRLPSQRRIFAIARALATGMSVDRVHELTRIDRFFLHEMDRVVRAFADDAPWQDRLRELKELGFSDEQIARRWNGTEAAVREERKAQGISPSLLQIDTLAAEYPAATAYSYLTYGARHDDLALPSGRAVLILGSGPYRIGSSVEFDWCCVQAALAAREAGIQTVLLNCNPETVSTDYDRSDLLVFDEISTEVVLELLAKRPGGSGKLEVVVSMGGQRPNTLAPALQAVGVPICGTPAESLDQAEDRSKFSKLCDRLDIDQPLWTHVTDEGHLDAEIERLGGYPVIVRPSYVLSGAAMSVVHHASHLRGLLARAARISPEHPVVISRFESNAREFDIDAVADGGELLLWAACEHIENAGIHSGDATLVLPPQRLYLETLRRAHRITRLLARELRITGPFNVQFLARRNEVKVIECNLRASRSFPFVSKMTGNNFAREAMRRMLGLGGTVVNRAFDIERVGVKASQFSFGRLAGADPFLGVEMRSTGEVACVGQDLHEALLKALWSTGLRRPLKGVLLSLGPYQEKYRFEEEARLLAGMGLKLFATSGTAAILSQAGITCEALGRRGEAGLPSALAKLDDGSIDLVVNVPRMFDEQGRPDGSEIRRRAVDRGIPLITDIDLARLFVQAMARHSDASLASKPATWRELLSVQSDGGRLPSTPSGEIPV
jgi:carbamoyl-phosphate synthase large subunit